MAEITNEQLLDQFVNVMREFRHTSAGCGCSAMHDNHTGGQDGADSPEEGVEHGHHAHGPAEEGAHHEHHKHGHGHGHGPCDPAEEGAHHKHHKHGPGHGHSPHGLMRMQMQQHIMRLIREKPGITADELAKEAQAPAHGIQRQLGMLEHEGLADIKKDGDKIVSATLTNVGIQRSEAESAERTKQANTFFGVLTAPEKEELSALLQKLAQPAADSE